MRMARKSLSVDPRALKAEAPWSSLRPTVCFDKRSWAEAQSGEGVGFSLGRRQSKENPGFSFRAASGVMAGTVIAGLWLLLLEAGRCSGGWGFPGELRDLSPLPAPLHSGKCHNEVVLAPMFERLSTESVQDQLPYSVTHMSMPATTESRRGFSVSVESACSNYATSVQVKE